MCASPPYVIYTQSIGRLLQLTKYIGVGTIFRLGEQQLNDFSVGEAKIGEQLRLIHVICRISQTSMYKLMQSVTTIMPLWKAVLSPLWRPSEAWGRGLLNRLNPLLLPRRRRYRIDLSPLRGSSSPVGTLSRRGWNSIKLAYKLAGWPAQLATSAFSQLSQYIC